MMEELTLLDLLPILAVALLWGITNPFISKSVEDEKDFKPLEIELSSTWRVIQSKAFLLPTAINQCGSVLYAVILGKYPQALASIGVNSLTVAVTFLTELTLKKGQGKFTQQFRIKQILGLACILSGFFMIL